MLIHPTTIALSFIILVCVLGSGYVVWVLLESYLEVHQSKKVKMFVCEIHGAIPMSYTSTFMDIPFCLRCWSTRWKAVKKAGK